MVLFVHSGAGFHCVLQFALPQFRLWAGQSVPYVTTGEPSCEERQ